MKLIKSFITASIAGVAFISAAVSAAPVYLVYKVEASDIVDSNFDAPPFPVSSVVTGTFTFVMDDSTGTGFEQNDLVPLAVTGFDITDNDNNLFDHDESNTAVDATRFPLTSGAYGQIKLGGTFNSNDFIAGGSDDFFITFAFNLDTYQPGSILEEFQFATSAFDFYEAQTNVVTLLYAGDVAPPSQVPVPAAIWLFASGLVGLAGFARRKFR